MSRESLLELKDLEILIKPGYKGHFKERDMFAKDREMKDHDMLKKYKSIHMTRETEAVNRLQIRMDKKAEDPWFANSWLEG